MEKVAAIVLAAGKGKRMNNKLPKQYMQLCGNPVVYYSLKVLEESSINEIILVVGEGEEELKRKELIEKYGFHKVTKIISGGKERYNSVFKGLQALQKADYVLIHDGARPLITSDIIEHTIDIVRKKKACVVAVPSKDTVKISNECNIVKETPDRTKVWMVQTPQAFEYQMIKQAYEKLLQKNDKNIITDDAMVLETMTNFPITLIEGSYQNIKITTPEDIQIAELFLKARL